MRGLILLVHGTDRPGLGFLLRSANNIYEEREARILILCAACLCKRSVRFVVRRREDSIIGDDAGGRCATLHKRRTYELQRVRARINARTFRQISRRVFE